MTDTERAYIAGFLDGDGSIILQIVRRHDYRLGFQIRASICFYQKVSGLEVLEWIKDRLVQGYIRTRKDMADYTIVGLSAVRAILQDIGPFVVLKRRHVAMATDIIDSALQIRGDDHLVDIAARVDGFARLNYSKGKKISAADVRKYFTGTLAH